MAVDKLYKKKATGRAVCKICHKPIKKEKTDYYTKGHHWTKFGYIEFINHYHKECLEKLN
jgi:hypothetical protein